MTFGKMFEVVYNETKAANYYSVRSKYKVNFEVNTDQTEWVR